LTDFLLLLITFLALWLGGWHWALFFAVAAIWLRFEQTGLWLPAFIWLLAFIWTGDRRLYFPFVIPLIVLVWGGQSARAGWGLVALFTAIRLAQGASARVLAVELAVTVVAVGVPLWLGRQATTPGARWACAMLGSLLAFAGLAF
jgi:hypothetical protein